MAFELTQLLGNPDLPDPNWDEVLERLNGRSGFIVEGIEDDRTAFFQVDRSGYNTFVQVEGLGDLEQYVLIDEAKGTALIRFVSEVSGGDVWNYPAFALVDRPLIDQAIASFVRTG